MRVRRGHPTLAAERDVASWADLSHLLVTERGDEWGRVDDVLETYGLKRRVALTVPSVALVADILGATDLVATVPRRAGLKMAQAGATELFRAPVDLGTWTMSLVWLARGDREPGLRWLRDLMRGTLAGDRLDIVNGSWST